MKRMRALGAGLALAGLVLGQSPAPATAGAPALSVEPSSGKSGTLVTIGADLAQTPTTCTLEQDGAVAQKFPCGPKTTTQFTVTGPPGQHTLTLCAPTCDPAAAAATASAPFTVLAVVPPLIGLRADALAKTLAAAGLRLGTVTGAAGTPVVSQDPPSGSVVKPDQQVNVTLGAGPPSSRAVLVPDLHGLRVTRARTLIRSLGLRLVVSTSAGYVQSQRPSAGTSVPAGADVTVTVRARVTVRFVAVPDLRGESIDAARATLAGVGLALSSPVSSGTVATQDLPPGRRVAAGATVTVTVELISSPTSSTPTARAGWYWAIAAAVLVLLALAGAFAARRWRRGTRPRPPGGPPPRVTCRATGDVLRTSPTRPAAPTVDVRIRAHTTLTMERKP